MDQYTATIIVAIVTGIFSVITLVIQKKQDKVIDKIDEQTLFIEKEKELKKKLTKKYDERDTIIHEAIILILDTNLSILNRNATGEINMSIDEVIAKAAGLKSQFDTISREIEEINKEYAVVLDLNSDYQKEVEKHKQNS